MIKQADILYYSKENVLLYFSEFFKKIFFCCLNIPPDPSGTAKKWLENPRRGSKGVVKYFGMISGLGMKQS